MRFARALGVLFLLVAVSACAGHRLVTVPCARGHLDRIEAGPLLHKHDDGGALSIGCHPEQRVLRWTVWGAEGMAWDRRPIRVPPGDVAAWQDEWTTFLLQREAIDRMSVDQRLGRQ
jgi:hypothetical protein